MAKKKRAPMSPFVPAKEQPYLIPENWCWVYVGAICLLIGGGTPDKSNPDYWNGDISWASVKDIKGDFLYSTKDSITVKGFNNGTSILCDVNDLILVTRIEPGKTIVSKISTSVNQDLKIVKSWLPSMFLHYYFTTFKHEFERKSSGSTVKGITVENVDSTPFPLPPVLEQQRIVDRIESLFAKLDEAKEKAQAVVDGFELRKSAILHKAFTGELTEQWRKEHSVGLDSWIRSPWGNFIVSIEAGKNWSAEGRPPEDGEFGVVKVSAVTWGEFDELESKTCTLNEQWNEKTQIRTGDFLFSRANTLQLVGNCVIVRTIDRRLMLSDKILRFTFDKSVVPEYVLHFTRSNLYREQIERLASGNQDGMRNVSQKNMKLVEFPVPSLSEQKEVVRIIGNLYSKEQQAKEAAEAVLEQIDTMKKAILARAFRGELGTNDPAEEWAGELVKRTL